MTRRVRIVLGLLILAVSLALLAWSLWPVPRETRLQPIPPEGLQLPTPSSFHFDSDSSLNASFPSLVDFS
jgi:hypothetical protein